MTTSLNERIDYGRAHVICTLDKEERGSDVLTWRQLLEIHELSCGHIPYLVMFVYVAYMINDQDTPSQQCAGHLP